MSDSDENITNNNGQIDPWYSKPLDVHRWSDHPEINKLVENLWITVVQPALGGRSNNTGLSGPKKQLKVLLLDLYVAWLEDPTLSVGISRNNNSYSVNSRYNALHISRKVVDIVDVLVMGEYLDYLHGSYDRQGNGQFNRTSRIRPTLKLQDQFTQLTISGYDIDHHHQEETVILTDYETDEEGNYTKSKITASTPLRELPVLIRKCLLKAIGRFLMGMGPSLEPDEVILLRSLLKANGILDLHKVF